MKPPNADLAVLSAKYGLVSEEVIAPYDHRLSHKRSEIGSLQRAIRPKVSALLRDYTHIVLQMGRTYRPCFGPFLLHPEKIELISTYIRQQTH